MENCGCSGCGCERRDPREELVRLFKVRDALKVLVELDFQIPCGESGPCTQDLLGSVEDAIVGITSDVV